MSEDSRTRHRSTLKSRTITTLRGLLSRHSHSHDLTTLPAHQGNQPSASLNGLPDDILWAIAEFTPTIDIPSFCLASRRMHAILLPALYKSLDLKSNTQCSNTLSLLIRRPDLSSNIQELVVRPRREPGIDGLSEAWVVSMIVKVASAGALSNLVTFTWDGEDAPWDELWANLHKYCNRLRNIGTCVSYTALKPDSNVYKFKDLISFKLTFKKPSSVRTLGLHFALDDLSDQFWEWLLFYHPHLETLAIDSGAYERDTFDIRKATKGRWPQLRSLKLAACNFSPAPFFDARFSKFVDAHPALEDLTLHPVSTWETSPPPVQILAQLSGLVQFNGAVAHLIALPNAGLPKLQCIRLSSLVVRSIETTELCSALSKFVSLVSLDIWLLEDESSAGQLTAILCACPHLLNLDMWSSYVHSPLSLHSFSASLRHSPTLQTLTLTKLRQNAEGGLTESAMFLARTHPGLRQISLRCYNKKQRHARFACPYDQYLGKEVIEERGDYEVKDLASYNFECLSVTDPNIGL